MSSEKRQRQRENRMRAVAAAERAKKRSSTTRKVLRVVLAVAAVLLALLLWSIFTGDDSSDSDTDGGGDGALAAEATEVTAFETDEPSDDTPPATEAAAEPEAEPAADDRSDVGAAPDPTACPAEDGSDGPLNQLPAPPPVCIDNEVFYAAAFDTNTGPFTMVLDPTLDPVSVNNFIVLARWGAYDGTLFHRVISDFVIQGGDVQLDFGRGGPGYQFTGDFPPADDWYRIGSVAMANRGNPATNGSQFFVITGPNGAGLPPLYSPLGHVVEGMDVVMEIEGVDTGPGDEPTIEVVVRSVTITEATQAQIGAYTDARS